ncbi:MAG: Kup system potassium uptake protein [Ilumatobacteraceae bacterium]|nr:Kup system potassium uptake protein [Ilumatobacteraceae bacterium]
MRTTSERELEATPVSLIPSVIGAFGVVFGDLATSPLYSIREAFENPDLPVLLLTYLGMGGGLLRDPRNVASPFFLLAPDSLRLPIVILATAATVIAAQSLTSGVFSVTYQAGTFGYAPRMRVVNTSPAVRGQVYLPAVNWCLMIAWSGSS